MYSKCAMRFKLLAPVIAVAAIVTCQIPGTVEAEDNLPPVITDFGWSNPWADYFIFYGTVEDEVPEGCLVEFGGVGEGGYASVDAYGEFYFVMEITPEMTGPMTAVAIDSELQYSAERGTYVFY